MSDSIPNQIPRTLAFARKWREKLGGKGPRTAEVLCPWCRTPAALWIVYLGEDKPFTIQCKARPDCFDYRETQKGNL